MRDIFIILLLVSSLNAQVRKHEAENMTVVAGPVVLPTDSVMCFWSWGTVSFNCDLAGDIKLTFRAAEDTAGSEHAKMEVKSPGSLILDTLEINQYNFSDFVLLKNNVEAGDFELAFINDFPQERNLHLDYVTVELLATTPDTASMKLTWLANSEADLKGYNVYYGVNSRDYPNVIDVGNVVQKIVDNLKYNQIYYAAVTAYDTADNESDFSDEISILLQTPEDDTLQGDYNNDGIVDFSDMVEFDRCFGSIQGGITWNAFFDFDDNGKIDFADMVVFDGCFGDAK